MNFLESEITRLNRELDSVRAQERQAALPVGPAYATLSGNVGTFTADYTVLQFSPDLQDCAALFASLGAPVLATLYDTLSNIALRTAVQSSSIPDFNLPYGIGAPDAVTSFDAKAIMQSVYWLRSVAP